MKHVLPYLLVVFICLMSLSHSAFSQIGTDLLISAGGESSINEYGRQIAYDGNRYVCGQFSSTAYF